MIYSDVELQYYISLIRKMQQNSGSEEFRRENRENFIMQYFNKTLETLKELMRLL